MSFIQKGKWRKPKRVVKGKKYTVHLRNLDAELYEELWSIRYAIEAFDWIDVVKYLVEKYREDELKELFP